MKEISIENKKTYLHKFKNTCNLFRASFFSSNNLKFYIFLKETRPYIENNKRIPNETLNSIPLTDYLQFSYLINHLKVKGYTLDDILIIINTLIKYEYYSNFVFPANIMYLNCFEYTSKTEFEKVKKYKRNRYSRAMGHYEKLAKPEEQDIDDELLEAENYLSKGINFAQQNIYYSNEIEDKQEKLVKIQKSSGQAKIAIYELNNFWNMSKSNSLYDNIAQVEEAITFLANEINNFSSHFNALEKKYFMFSPNDFPKNQTDYNRLTNSSEIRDIYSCYPQDQDKLEKLFYSEVIKLMAYDLSLYDEIQDDSLNVDADISRTKIAPCTPSEEEAVDKVSEKDEDSTKVTNEEEFTLPDDLFDMTLVKDNSSWIGGIKEPEYRNPKALEKLINDFAAQGYFRNDKKTKETFAFILTGRNKPLYELEKITWEKDYNTLFYFIKEYASKSEKYKIIKRFLNLEGVEDPAIESPGSYAKRPNKEMEKYVDRFLQLKRNS